MHYSQRQQYSNLRSHVDSHEQRQTNCLYAVQHWRSRARFQGMPESQNYIIIIYYTLIYRDIIYYKKVISYI